METRRAGWREKIAVLYPDISVRSVIVRWLHESEIDVPRSSDPSEELAEVNVAFVGGASPQQAAAILTSALEQTHPMVLVLLNDVVARSLLHLREVGTGRDRTEEQVAFLGWVRLFNRLARALLFDDTREVDEGRPAPPPGLARLTRRERQVLPFVVAGADNLKIAAHLAIRERTVKAHVSNLFRKLDCENRVQLAMRASRLGIQPAPEA